MMKPKIRFKGFEGEWKAEELAHVCSVNRGVRVTRNDLHNNGIYPVYQNTDYPMGYYTKFNVESNNPFVIVGGSAGLIGFCHTNFWAADDCVFFGDNPIINKSFLYNNLIFHKTEIKRNVRGASVPRLDRETLRKLPVSIPSLPEQQEIASYFTSLDSQISASTSRLASLKQMKAASLQAMFPQEGETVPKIRFKGFEGEWKKVKFSELYERSSIKNDLSFGTDKIISVANMYFIKNSRQVDDDYLRSYNIMRLGDIAFEGNKSKNFAHGRLVENTIGDGIVSHVFIVMKPISKNYDLNFWKYYINNENIMGNILVRSTKSSTMMTDLVVDDFLKESILVPSYEEQIEIGKILTSLDRQISLQSQRLEKLKQIKSACLDKMFV